MSTQWLRLWHDMPTDPKWRTIAKVSGQRIGDVMAVYLHVLVDASNATERGRTHSINCEDVASSLDVEVDQVASIIDAMQGRVLDGDHVRGWEKRQVAREDGASERAKAWREAKKVEKRTQTNATERGRTQGERKQTPDTDTDTDTEKEESKDSCASAVAERVGESSKSDEGEFKLPAALQSRFDRFWLAYPRRKGKGAAARAWKKINPTEVLLAKILLAVTRDKASPEWRKDAGQFIPHPATWLNQERWLDDASGSDGGGYDDSVAGVIAGAMIDVRQAA